MTPEADLSMPLRSPLAEAPAIVQTTMALSAIIPASTAAMYSAKFQPLVHRLLWSVGSRMATHMGLGQGRQGGLYGRSDGTNRLGKPFWHEPLFVRFSVSKPSPPGLRRLPHFRRQDGACSRETSTLVSPRQDLLKRTRYFLRACPMTQCLGG